MRNKLQENRYMRMLPMILALAWPTMLEQMMQTAVQYIDLAMIGSLGTDATAAVGSTSTINWLVSSSISALGVGFLAQVSRACGAGDRELTRRLSGQAVLVTLLAGSFFTMLTVGLSPVVPEWMQVDVSIQEMAARYFMILYLPMLPRSASIILGTVLRASGDTRTPMKVGIYVNVINTVLNFFLIFPSRTMHIGEYGIFMPGAGWGVQGAAIASAIAYTVGGVMITRALWKHPLVSPRGCSIRPDGRLLRPCLRIAVPNMFQRFGTSLGYVVFAAMINSLGEVSAAAHVIANTVESAFYIPAYGMQTAAATLAGNALGANDREKMHSFTRMIIVIEVLLMLLSGGALFLFAPGIVSLFSDSAEVIRLGSFVLRMVAVSEPFYGVSIIIEGILQGLGNTFVPFLFGVSGMWCIRIVGTWLCIYGMGLGLISAWACMITHNLMLFGAYVFYYFRGRWNPLEQSFRDEG